MRQIILDTETTGLNPDEGHRIIEIGCVEIVDRRLTENRFHVYLNPERDIDEGAIGVHGLSNAFLADKPRFADIIGDFIEFIKGAEVIIHNAPFDVGFLNYELKLLERDYGEITDFCSVLDTLAMARKKHPGQRNSLDALCRRYAIDNSHRELHGALLDAEILASVFLAMTGGQSSLVLEQEDRETVLFQADVPADRASRPQLKVIACSAEELADHERYLSRIEQINGGRCLWKQ